MMRDNYADGHYFRWNAPEVPAAASEQTLTFGTLVTPDHLCLDLLRYEQIGAADNLRGRVVRAFLWMMRLWPIR